MAGSRESSAARASQYPKSARAEWEENINGKFPGLIGECLIAYCEAVERRDENLVETARKAFASSVGNALDSGEIGLKTRGIEALLIAQERVTLIVAQREADDAALFT